MVDHKSTIKISTVDAGAEKSPMPTNFDEFLPWVCLQNYAEFNVIISPAILRTSSSTIETDKKKNVKTKQPKTISSPSTIFDSISEDSKLLNKSLTNENKVMIETIYNSNGNLVQLKLLKNKNIPRMLIQLITLTIPYQQKLTSIVINSGLNEESFNEICNFLPKSQITELCFDDTFLEEANCHQLLMHGKLKHLSLARCAINDDTVEMIAHQLKDPCPAAKVLSALNLSSNKITDIGAKHLAVMLRTNRQLCYLSLAGNVITDEGGVSILDTLHKFPVQSQELQESRIRYVAFLKKKNALIKGMQNDVSFDKNTAKKKMQKRVKTGQYMAAVEIDDSGLFEDVFSPKNTRSKDDVVYCLGNNTLFCLNLAYNNLSFISLKKLLEVLTNQKYLNRTPRGLIKVVIEGNLMPVACKEYEQIDQILAQSSRKQLETPTKKKPLISQSNITLK